MSSPSTPFSASLCPQDGDPRFLLPLVPTLAPLSLLLPQLLGHCSPLTWELPQAGFRSQAPSGIQSMRNSVLDTSVTPVPGRLSWKPRPVQPSPGSRLYNQHIIVSVSPTGLQALRGGFLFPSASPGPRTGVEMQYKLMKSSLLI